MNLSWLFAGRGTGPIRFCVCTNPNGKFGIAGYQEGGLPVFRKEEYDTQEEARKIVDEWNDELPKEEV
jgi:hypothetical protein